SRRIKSAAASRTIPVLHISATYGEADMQLASSESGAEIFVAEPVDPRELATIVRTMLRLRTAEIRLAERETRLRLAAQFAGVASWEFNVRTGEAAWDHRFFELLGCPASGGASWAL